MQNLFLVGSDIVERTVGWAAEDVKAAVATVQDKSSGIEQKYG